MVAGLSFSAVASEFFGTRALEPPTERVALERGAGMLFGAGTPNASGGRLLRALTQRWLGQGGELTEHAEPRTPDRTLESLHAARPEVIEEILVSLSPRIRQWLHRRLGPDAALDDVAQEALTELARALPTFEGRSSLATFAYRITARVSARHIKRRRAQREHLGQRDAPLDPQSPGLDPERTAIEQQALRAVLACLERLPARRREAFVLCELEGETPKSAARLLGTSENAVRSRLMHARRELERRLRGRDFESLLRGPP